MDDANETKRSIAEEVLMMDSYVRDAQQAWTHEVTDHGALDKIRKVAALAIRCLETHGCPERGLDCNYIVD